MWFINTMQIYDFIDFLFWDNDFLIISKKWGVWFWFDPQDLIDAYFEWLTFEDLYNKNCNDYVNELQKDYFKKWDKKEIKKQKWYIYLIQAWNYYKIWKTININKRIKTYITENPNKIELLYYKIFDDILEIEKNLHDKFKNKHHKWEWFILDENDILFIKNL